jgi:hypothetical protein
MTVDELIQKLKEWPGNDPVYVMTNHDTEWRSPNPQYEAADSYYGIPAGLFL